MPQPEVSIWIHLHRMSRKSREGPLHPLCTERTDFRHHFVAVSYVKARVSAPFCAYLQTNYILVSKLDNKAQQLYVCWFDVFIYRSLKLYILPLERHTEKWNEFSLSHIGKIRSHVQRYWLANTHTGHTATTNRIYGFCHQCVNSTHYTCSVVGK